MYYLASTAMAKKIHTRITYNENGVILRVKPIFKMLSILEAGNMFYIDLDLSKQGLQAPVH